MNDEELKKWERHIAKPMEFEFEDNEGNKDKFMFKPLPMEYIGDMFYVSSVMVELNSGKQPANLDEAMSRASKLIIETLKLSYPELSDEIIIGFAKKHYGEILNAVFVVNQFLSKTAKVEEKIAQIRRNIEKPKE